MAISISIITGYAGFFGLFPRRDMTCARPPLRHSLGSIIQFTLHHHFIVAVSYPEPKPPQKVHKHQESCTPLVTRLIDKIARAIPKQKARGIMDCC